MSGDIGVQHSANLNQFNPAKDKLKADDNTFGELLMKQVNNSSFSNVSKAQEITVLSDAVNKVLDKLGVDWGNRSDHQPLQP